MDLVAYIRVSQVGEREGDSFQSPDEQRRAIQSIVALTPGARVVAELEDLDESGGTMDRFGVQDAIGMVQSGKADGIVCAYLDRWARTMEALELIEQWTKQGKTFISARERFDASTSAGRFTLGMMLLVAKYYRDRISESWETSTRNAIERGVHVTVPYGYRRGENGGRPHRKGGTRGVPLVVEAGEASVVRRIFMERSQGTGISVIAAGLNADGIPSPRGGIWTRQSVRALLRVRAYKGEASRGENVMVDAHEAIVSAAEWDAVQAERATGRTNGKSLLVGLVRCAGCGYVMGAGSSSHGGRRYNCNRHHAELRCPSPTTAPADPLEQLVIDEFLGRYGSAKLQGASTVDPLVAATQAAVQSASVEYVTWRDDVQMRSVIGTVDYREGLLARKQAVTDAERAHVDAVRQAKSGALSVDADVWATLDLPERRELLRAGMDAIVLGRASSTRMPLGERVELVWAGELDHDGSRSGIAAVIRGRP